MSKRRPRRRAKRTPARAPSRPAVSGIGTQAQVVPETPIDDAELRQEYRHVISDLKRIGLVAASMFAVLVILALIVT